jgi:hypothetical protein
MRTEVFLNSSCAGLTRASIFFARSLTKWMDCRVKPGNDSGASECNPKLHEMTAGAISLFRVVIYNDFCNSHVSGRRGPNLLPKMCRPICHPDVAPSVVI